MLYISCLISRYLAYLLKALSRGNPLPQEHAFIESTGSGARLVLYISCLISRYLAYLLKALSRGNPLPQEHAFIESTGSGARLEFISRTSHITSHITYHITSHVTSHISRKTSPGATPCLRSTPLLSQLEVELGWILYLVHLMHIICLTLHLIYLVKHLLGQPLAPGARFYWVNWQWSQVGYYISYISCISYVSGYISYIS